MAKAKKRHIAQVDDIRSTPEGQLLKAAIKVILDAADKHVTPSQVIAMLNTRAGQMYGKVTAEVWTTGREAAGTITGETLQLLDDYWKGQSHKKG